MVGIALGVMSLRAQTDPHTQGNRKSGPVHRFHYRKHHRQEPRLVRICSLDQLSHRFVLVPLRHNRRHP